VLLDKLGQPCTIIWILLAYLHTHALPHTHTCCPPPLFVIFRLLLTGMIFCLKCFFCLKFFSVRNYFVFGDSCILTFFSTTPRHFARVQFRSGYFSEPCIIAQVLSARGDGFLSYLTCIFVGILVLPEYYCKKEVIVKRSGLPSYTRPMIRNRLGSIICVQ